MRPLVKLILKLVFSLMLLLFINNPILPLSIFMMKGEVQQWYPLFRPDAVGYYQQIFTLLVVLGICVAVLEYFFRNPIWELVEEVPNILGLFLVRAIPEEAVNFDQIVLEKVYPVFYVILSILLLLAAVGLVLKIFNFVAIRNEATKP